MLVEPLIFSKLKEGDEASLKEDQEFMQHLQVLLISYHNLGITQIRLKNKKYARTVFEHGWKMSKKLIGRESDFAQKFESQIMKHFSPKKNGHRGHSDTNSQNIRSMNRRHLSKRQRPFTSYSSSTSKHSNI